jgi:protein PhnA
LTQLQPEVSPAVRFVQDCLFILQDGDTVTVIKDIRLVDADYDIDCKIDAFGAMSLTSEFVRKV